MQLHMNNVRFTIFVVETADRLCALVVRAPGYRSGYPRFDFTRSSEPETWSTQPREDN
jgi:hypothetical protein